MMTMMFSYVLDIFLNRVFIYCNLSEQNVCRGAGHATLISRMCMLILGVGISC